MRRGRGRKKRSGETTGNGERGKEERGSTYAETRKLTIATCFTIVLRRRLAIELEDGGTLSTDATFDKVNIVNSAGRGGSLVGLAVKRMVVSLRSGCREEKGERMKGKKEEKKGKEDALNALQASADESLTPTESFSRSLDEVDGNTGDLGDAIDGVVLEGVAKLFDADGVLLCIATRRDKEASKPSGPWIKKERREDEPMYFLS